jgi:hypothetical protein
LDWHISQGNDVDLLKKLKEGLPHPLDKPGGQPLRSSGI